MKKFIFCFNNFFGSAHFLIHQIGEKGQKIARAKKVFNIKNQFIYAHQPRKGIFKIHSHQHCNFITFFPELLMAASIPGVEIFSWKSACVVFFNMQNSNFRGAPESERTGFVLILSQYQNPSMSVCLAIFSSPFPLTNFKST